MWLAWEECETNERALRPEPEGPRTPQSERRVAWLSASFDAGRCRWHFGFRAAEPADGVGANAPEDGDLRGLRFLGLAVLALVHRTDELSVHEDVVALVERVGDGLAEAVEGHDAVAVGFGLPLVVRVVP